MSCNLITNVTNLITRNLGNVWIKSELVYFNSLFIIRFDFAVVKELTVQRPRFKSHFFSIHFYSGSGTPRVFEMEFVMSRW